VEKMPDFRSKGHRQSSTKARLSVQLPIKIKEYTKMMQFSLRKLILVDGNLNK
jgi:hypothetical protein